MKKYKFQFERKIIAAALLILFLLIDCNKDKNNGNDLLLALILFNLGSKAEFHISSTNALATDRTTADFKFRVGPYAAAGFLTDLAGDDPQNYGDGPGDGFNDHFITPAAVSIGICQILAYKSVAKGGPAKGSETLENYNFLMFKITGPNTIPGAKMCESGFASIGLQTGNGVSSSDFLPISQIPNEERQDYDRIGIIAKDFTYYFDPKDVPEHSYRYVSLDLNPPVSSSDTGLTLGIGRGDVNTKLFDKVTCSTSFIDFPGYIFSDLFKPEDQKVKGCRLSSLGIDSGSGRVLNTGADAEFSPFTNPERTLNPPSVVGVDYNSASQRLKFKTPAAMNDLNKNEPYILVINFDPSKKNGNILFNVSIDNVLFWDSNTMDNVFSPQLDLTDRPNATSGADNLTNTARKNLIFHLPTILSKTN
ncbi:sigma factor sigX-regulated lipoprotein SrpA [Leptospira santarosai]|uniref:sigma factor sigX-regulated lipoprotein SrpA n=1 Tax=Leptospira santarosai TaxID=28183 RepID=UPI0007746295|nr:hypothetical protein [Leptospira santarosai]MDI7225883.1 hypothetical protein [Leptospira santarosai]MDI7229035.1 hypothetical protein [Leptospira santarosai]